MRQTLKGVASALALSVLLLSAAPTAAYAATTATDTDGFNVLISPLPTKLVTEPGKTVSTELRIKNQNSKPETIKAGLMKFGATGSDGTPNIADLTAKDTYGKWVHFSPSTFVAEPNVWKTVRVTIDVPRDAALGYYLAVTFSRASQGTTKDATNLRGAVASLVLLDVHVPNEKRQVGLVDFTTDHGLYEYLPASFNVKLHNNGNIYVAPTGNIFIQKHGTSVSTLDFNTAGGSVLPGSNRVFAVKWHDGFPSFQDRLVDGKPVAASNGQTKQDLKWDFTQLSKLRIGKYTAKLLVVYNDGTRDVPIESTVSFWVFPWKIALLLLLIVIIIGIGLFGAGRTFVNGTRRSIGKVRHAGKR